MKDWQHPADAHIEMAEREMGFDRDSSGEVDTGAASAHALISIAKSLERLANQGDIRIARAER